ncbi:peptide chain release factor N(5)-glutamine methyltransferase [Venenivibrio stagnispumantis]|uniref:Release factor glutamine methyltransferase n=1 Tax=Venenivibrio stagnispumantis TaxID=407998 RepID=A0AA46AE29_9AQUI|nr:peptide chain release factor N(5)-glutamine methyltransferase [Venenivibrio stagnispumantis]MCW4573335.1 peptide chain release factor N(5)-glutamine methyltransferase [Venenivibrio stagnispumantis]SMP10736.1 release factor glutamine methyltransferase [Venenivibrio stagnispumantis]
MKLKELYEKVINKLKEAEIPNPQLEALIIISESLNIPKYKVITEPDLDIINYQEVLKVAEKRAKRYPLAYLINKKEFFGITFYIEEGVLIPRPETEILVEEILKILPTDKEIIGLDIGTGSGVVSLSLLKNRENLRMYATDISEKALKITEKNAKILKLYDRIKIIKSNLFENIDEKFDFIVSNPPYIPEEEYEYLQEEVKKEPKEALISKEGIYFYEEIIKQAKNYLKEDGFLAFEIGYNQAEKVKQILKSYGYEDIKIIKDLQDIERVIIARR